MVLRQYSLVQMSKKLSDADKSNYPSFFYDGSEVVYLGEIPNKEGYGIFATKNHTFIGYQISLFEERC